MAEMTWTEEQKRVIDLQEPEPSRVGGRGKREDGRPRGADSSSMITDRDAPGGASTGCSS